MNWTPRAVRMAALRTTSQWIPSRLTETRKSLIRAESSGRPNVDRAAVGDHSRWFTARELASFGRPRSRVTETGSCPLLSQ